MSEKVVLPREVAEAIERSRNHLEWTDGNILVRTVRREWESEEMLALNNFVQSDEDRLTIAKAIINGYEVEQTPEDRVREYAEHLKFSHMRNNGGRNDTETSYGHELRGCMKTMDMLGLKIEGVNA